MFDLMSCDPSEIYYFVSDKREYIIVNKKNEVYNFRRANPKKQGKISGAVLI
jgi:hypothetical protein